MSIFVAVWLYLYVFGALTIAGGVVGFVRAKSRASLIAGTVAGALLFVSAYLVGKGAARDGLFLGLAISASLSARFVGAFVRSRKVMPAGVMSLLSITGCVLTVLALTR
ncbi:TMEM14 family protein [Labilithrix luteola]|nr:TMEM14 family protein [Labilithrix luteola]